MSGSYTYGFNFTNWGDWKTKEEKEIRIITSSSFGIEYINYPLVNVVNQLSLELEDQINGSKDGIIISQSDITDKWKNVIK